MHLEEHGIRDRNLWHLQKLVAREIRSLYGVASEQPDEPAQIEIA